jgi:hypothetical protein
MEIISGYWRGEKIEYHNGIGCCLWMEPSGLCVDFWYEDIDDIMTVLKTMKTAKPERWKDYADMFKFRDMWR